MCPISPLPSQTTDPVCDRGQWMPDISLTRNFGMAVSGD